MAACDSKERARLRNRARTLVGVSAVALVACLPRTTNATDRVTFTLSSSVMSVSGELHATVRVDPHDENRLLRVTLDGPLYYASTDVQLDGAEAARVHDMWFRFLPPGEYAVTATVECATGRRFVEHKSLRVIGLADSMDSSDPVPSIR